MGLSTARTWMAPFFFYYFSEFLMVAISGGRLGRESSPSIDSGLFVFNDSDFEGDNGERRVADFGVGGNKSF